MGSVRAVLDLQAKAILDQATRRLIQERYDQPVMSNLVRPDHVEFLISVALGGDWPLVSADGSGWDLQHKDGARLEVKPSAAQQTWTGRASLEGRATRGSFDVGGRKGCWVEGGKQHVAWEGRPADLFVFAWHPVIDPARVDQRDPRPWLFFVVPEPALPVPQKRLGLALIERREQTSVADVAFEPAR
jgi:hypothetical protein